MSAVDCEAVPASAQIALGTAVCKAKRAAQMAAGCWILANLVWSIDAPEMTLARTENRSADNSQDTSRHRPTATDACVKWMLMLMFALSPLMHQI